MFLLQRSEYINSAHAYQCNRIAIGRHRENAVKFDGQDYSITAINLQSGRTGNPGSAPATEWAASILTVVFTPSRSIVTDILAYITDISRRSNFDDALILRPSVQN